MPSPRDVERIHEVPLDRINQMFVANEGMCLDCGFEDVPDDQDAAGAECEACGEPQFWSAFSMLLEREETV